MKHSTPSGPATCAHCGTSFRPITDKEYCCQGCRYVARLLRENGFGRFYELKGSRAVPPVGTEVFEPMDTDWLEKLQAAAEAEEDTGLPAARLRVEGISCIGCVWLIEALFRQSPGAAEIRIDAGSQAAEIRWESGNFALADFARRLRQLGYRPAPYETEATGGSGGTRPLTQRLGLCAFFLLNTMLFTLPGYLGMGSGFFLAPLFQLLGAIFATLSLLVGGGYFIGRAAQSLRTRILHIDLPIALGLVAAYTGSMIGWASGYTPLIYFDFVATFVFLMLAGRWLQETALERNRQHFKQRKAGPEPVTLSGGARDGERISADSLEAGTTYTVAPGAINPVAADPLDAHSTLSLEWINGESTPLAWTSDQTAPAGAINAGHRSLRFRAREAWNDSLLAQLLQPVPDTFRDHRLQKILGVYIACVLGIAFAGGLAWLLTTGAPLQASRVFISVLVVSCPCALGVALPLCDELTINRLRRDGLFIRSGTIWERLRRIQTVVFDKTGTLTMSTPRMTDPGAIRRLDPPAARALYKLVAGNGHPVARALREALLTHNKEPAPAPVSATAGGPSASGATETGGDTVREIPGKGIRWTDADGHTWTLGTPGWESADASGTTPGADEARSVLRRDGKRIADFPCTEDVRDEARETLQKLGRTHKLAIAILSGDAPGRVERIARALGLPASAALAGLSPDDKATWIDRHAPGRALMIGDGANDSLAFNRAACRGTPAVGHGILENTADFYFFGRSLRCLQSLFQATTRRRRTVAAVFLAAVFYNTIAVSICLAGLMHPLLAALLMPASSLATLAIAWIGIEAGW